MIQIFQLFGEVRADFNKRQYGMIAFGTESGGTGIFFLFLPISVKIELFADFSDIS